MSKPTSGPLTRYLELLDGLTPGPWRAVGKRCPVIDGGEHFGNTVVGLETRGPAFLEYEDICWNNPTDARGIAAMRNVQEALIAEMERLRAFVDSLPGEMELTLDVGLKFMRAKEGRATTDADIEEALS